MKKNLLTFILSAIVIFSCSPVKANVPENSTKENTSNETLKPYTFCFTVLPAFAEACSPMDVTKNILTTPTEVKRILLKDNLSAPYDLNDVEVNTIKHDAREIIVWTLPEPTKTTIPLYVAFVPDNDHYRYFTFEYAMDDNFEFGKKWVLGEQTTKGHRSYGFYDRPEDWTGFVDIIIDKFLK